MGLSLFGLWGSGIWGLGVWTLGSGSGSLALGVWGVVRPVWAGFRRRRVRLCESGLMMKETNGDFMAALAPHHEPTEG